MDLLVLIISVIFPFLSAMPPSPNRTTLEMLLKNKETVDTSNDRTDDIQAIVRQAKSADPNVRFEAVNRARILLSASKNAKELPISEFISAGFLPILVNCLESDDATNLVWFASWTLANIACGSTDQRNAIVEAGVVPRLVNLLQSSNVNACVHAGRALDNIVSGGPDLAHAVVKAGAVPKCLKLLESSIENVRTKAVQVLTSIIEKIPNFDDYSIDEEHIQIMRDEQLTQKILRGIMQILKKEQHRDVFIKKMEACGGLDKIEQLERQESKEILKMCIKRHQPISRENLLKNVEAKFGEEILSHIVQTSGIQLSDIEENVTAKAALETSVVLPALNPGLFTGLRAPPKGILLFGPPGNGKTMLAKAVANECQATFFSISASTIASKWYGESENLVKTLFQMARNAQPSIIFIDEIDSLLCQRSSKDGDGARRVKTEFLVQMDGFSSSSMANERVLVLGATNRPQDLDEAVLRRFSRRIFVDLPNSKARAKMIQNTFERTKTKLELSDDELAEIANKTENYSYSDLWDVCVAAAYCPVQSARENDWLLRKTTGDKLRPVTATDLECAMRTVKASSNAENRQELIEFAKKYAKLP
uniref:microtubule-severing ATPase n=1 Tax=Globodera rostochiensis TaxID=31243 RepID=A0A914HHD5_GLORO